MPRRVPEAFNPETFTPGKLLGHQVQSLWFIVRRVTVVCAKSSLNQERTLHFITSKALSRTAPKNRRLGQMKRIASCPSL